MSYRDEAENCKINQHRTQTKTTLQQNDIKHMAVYEVLKGASLDIERGKKGKDINKRLKYEIWTGNKGQDEMKREKTVN